MQDLNFVEAPLPAAVGAEEKHLNENSFVKQLNEANFNNLPEFSEIPAGDDDDL